MCSDIILVVSKICEADTRCVKLMNLFLTKRSTHKIKIVIFKTLAQSQDIL